MTGFQHGCDREELANSLLHDCVFGNPPAPSCSALRRAPTVPLCFAVTYHHTVPALSVARGGFFEGDDDFCQALIDGGCVKALQLVLVRDVEGAQFVEALEEALAPRMRLMGGAQPLRHPGGSGYRIDSAHRCLPMPAKVLKHLVLALAVTAWPRCDRPHPRAALMLSAARQAITFGTPNPILCCGCIMQTLRPWTSSRLSSWTRS
jgi:hypothetical protein